MFIQVIRHIYEEAYAEYCSKIYMLLCFSLSIFDIIDPLLDFFSSYPILRLWQRVYFLYTYFLGGFMFIMLVYVYDFSYTIPV